MHGTGGTATSMYPIRRHCTWLWSQCCHLTLWVKPCEVSQSTSRNWVFRQAIWQKTQLFQIIPSGTSGHMYHAWQFRYFCKVLYYNLCIDCYVSYLMTLNAYISAAVARAELSHSGPGGARDRHSDERCLGGHIQPERRSPPRLRRTLLQRQVMCPHCWPGNRNCIEVSLKI